MIDWFTVVAQIVNFLILVALLKYFLYGRVLAAMSKRKQELTTRWDEAQRQRGEAAKELESAHEKNRQLDAQREQLLAKVRDDVEQYRQELTSNVRAEVDDLKSRWSDAIHEQTDSFLRDLRRRTAEEVCAIARRVLADLADARLEDQMVGSFLQKLQRLDNDQRRELIASLREGDRVVVVQSAHELADHLKQAVRETLQRRFLEDLEVQFEQSNDLLCGIALQTDAHKLAWNLRDYLTALEQELRRSLEEESAARPSPHQRSASPED